MPEVVFAGVSKVYPGGITAVQDLNLLVRHGELLVMVGPSACGKTTTLRLLAGLEAPTSGRIHVGGMPMAGVAPAQRDVGFVFQRPVLYPQRTVRGNLAFGLVLQQRDSWWRRLFSSQRRLQHEALQQQVTAVAEMLGLEQVLDRYPAELSGGQQQRLALGRALVRRPAILVLDEPLSNLDTLLRQELRRQLHLLQRRLQATMLYVTHDPLEAMTLGDRIAVMERGRVVQLGTGEEIFFRPVNRFVAGFFGWPPMNFVDGELQMHDGQMAFVALPGRLAVPGSVAERWAPWVGCPLTLGIRPEDVKIGSAGWPMQVGWIESFGHSTLTTFGNQTVEITAWSQGGCHFPLQMDTMPAEKNVMIGFSLEKGYLFDRGTGAALAVRPAG